jgi:hypothetical protein
VRVRTRLIGSGVLAGAIGCSFVVGQLTVTNAARASAARIYTLRVGDRVLIPSVGQRCTVYVEGGAPELFCDRSRRAHHQVTFFRDDIQVWKVGNPDSPVWSGKP